MEAALEDLIGKAALEATLEASIGKEMPASILDPPTGNNPSPPSPMGVTTGANPPVLSGHHPGLCPCPSGHAPGLPCPDPYPCPHPDPKWAADLFVDPCATKPPPVGVVPNSMVIPWFVVKANLTMVDLVGMEVTMAMDTTMVIKCRLMPNPKFRLLPK